MAVKTKAAQGGRTMYVGVDVGGTFTDAVLLDGGTIRTTAKIATKDDLLETILEALDIVLKMWIYGT